jgi:hypothetical protein
LAFFFALDPRAAIQFFPSVWAFRFIVNAIKTRQLSLPGFYANGALH